SGLDQSCHPSDRVFDRNIWIDTVEIEEVDRVDSESAQTRFAGLPCIFRPAVHQLTSIDEDRPATFVPAVTELGRNESIAPPALDGPTDQFLVVACAVHIAGVEEIDPKVERVT